MRKLVASLESKSIKSNSLISIFGRMRAEYYGLFYKAPPTLVMSFESSTHTPVEADCTFSVMSLTVCYDLSASFK